MSTPPALDVRLLWLPEALPGALLSAVDVLASAATVWRLRQPGRPVPLRWALVGADGRRIALPGGLLPASPRPRLPAGTPVLWVLPPLLAEDAPRLDELLVRHAAAVRLLRAQAAAGAAVVCLGNGLVLAGAAGWLDGRRAAAPWPYLSGLRRRLPGADLAGALPVAADGPVFSCAAPALATRCLVQALASLWDADLADACAQVLDWQPERQAMVPALADQAWLPRTAESPVIRALRWLDEHLAQPYDLAALAAAAATSPRTLLRHFQAAQGCTPLAHLQRLRIARAKLLLETTLQGHDAIATACGYADAASLRRLFRRATGVSMSAWRQRHALRARRPAWGVRTTARGTARR